jgi:hypothetical protein
MGASALQIRSRLHSGGSCCWWRVTFRVLGCCYSLVYASTIHTTVPRNQSCREAIGTID